MCRVYRQYTRDVPNILCSIIDVFICRFVNTGTDVFQTPRLWRKACDNRQVLHLQKVQLVPRIPVGYQPQKISAVSYSDWPSRETSCPKRENSNYHNVGEILRVLETFLNFFDEFPMPHLETFHFTFACEARDLEGSTVIGTGGQMLESVKRVLSSLEGVKRLIINELHLDVRDGPRSAW